MNNLGLKLVSAVRASRITDIGTNPFPGHKATLKTEFPYKSSSVLFGREKILTYGNFPCDYWPQIRQEIRNAWGFEISKEFETVNAVFTGKIKSHCNNDISIRLESLYLYLPNVQYEPESFPGAIIKFLSNPKVTLLLYSKGSIVITGIKTLDFSETEEYCELEDMVNEILEYRDLTVIAQPIY